MNIKNKIVIAFMLLGSGFFLYEGFSMLFHPQVQEKVVEQNITK